MVGCFYLELAKLLMERGANINATVADGPYSGVSILWWAVFHKNWELVNLLMERGADINAAATDGPHKGISILWWAAFHKNWKLANLLIEKGADIRATDTDGTRKGISILWWSVFHKHWEVAKLLMKQGANINATAADGTHKGRSILWLAINNENWEVAKLLIEKGADLESAIKDFDNRAILRALLKFPIKIIEGIVNCQMDGIKPDVFENINKYYCPVTKELILHPVTMPDGILYESKSASQLIKDGNFTSPITRDVFANTIVPKMSVAIAQQIECEIISLGNKLLELTNNEPSNDNNRPRLRL
jgi:ankyrin repeat protein